MRQQHIDELAEAIRQSVFHELDSEPDLTGDDAGRVAALVETAVRAGLTAIEADRPSDPFTAAEEILQIMFADRETGELTGDNTIPEKSGADALEAIADVLDRAGLVPSTGTDTLVPKSGVTRHQTGATRDGEEKDSRPTKVHSQRDTRVG